MTISRRRMLQAGLAAPLAASGACRDAPSPAADAIRPPDETFVSELPRLMEVSQTPGLGIGIVRTGRLEWQHYAGLADVTTATPITASSLFPGCSFGKPLFAYAVLMLAEEGKLDLDRPLAVYLGSDEPEGLDESGGTYCDRLGEAGTDATS